MWLCGLGLLSIPYTDNVFLWMLETGIMDIGGMVMLYPTLSAAVANFAPIETRNATGYLSILA